MERSVMMKVAERVFYGIRCRLPATTVGALLLVVSAQAQQRETFSKRSDKRAETVRKIRARTQTERDAAQAWAAKHGRPMRLTKGRKTIALVAIRNGVHIWYATENENAAISTGASQVRNCWPYAVDGSGVTVGVWDEGAVLSSHQEFDARVTNKNRASSSSHSTHVGGTLGAAGVNASAQGMAPAVEIFSYDWDYDVLEMNAVAAAEPDEDGALYLSNHSYGSLCGWVDYDWSGYSGWHWPYWVDWASDSDARFGQYDAGAVDYDEVVYNAPYYLPFVAAGNDRNDGPSDGNTVYYSLDEGDSWESVIYDSSVHPAADGVYKDGYDTIKSEACAKNILTVGSVDDAVAGTNRAPANADMTDYSSWGPADDGRIKPDIVANGEWVKSCDHGSDTDYAYMSGTSMATPNATGSAALLVQLYGDLFPGQAMRASTLKGLILHTADDLGNPGPDYAYGWGLMNTKAAADLILSVANGHTSQMTEAYLATSHKTDTQEIHSDGLEPLRITLCWTDPAGDEQFDADSRTARLENDLDLKVTGPDGTHYPYSLSYSNPSADATTAGENNVDNVEQVYIAAPQAGDYTITVNYDGRLSGSKQWYSLLISGETFDTDGDAIPDGWESIYFSSPTGAVAGVDSDGDGQDNLSEYISGHNPSLAESRFEVTEMVVPSAGNTAPFILSWDAVSGRVYRVSWADALIGSSSVFTNLSGDLPYPVNSYTDTVERAGSPQFYKLEVRLGP
jgi:hypothetical protein